METSQIRVLDVAEGQSIKVRGPSCDFAVNVLEIREGEILLSIDANRDTLVYSDDLKPRQIWGLPKCDGLPRLWILFSLILAHSIRKDVFFPIFNEFLEDYLLARRRCRRKWARRWCACAFSLRTVAMIGTCLSLQYCGVWLSRLLSLLHLFRFH